MLVVFEKWMDINHEDNPDTAVLTMNRQGQWLHSVAPSESASIVCEKEYGKLIFMIL